MTAHTSYPIYLSGSSRVLATAAAETKLAFAPSIHNGPVIEADRAPENAFYLGLLSESAVARDLIARGRLPSPPADPYADAYEILVEDRRIYLLGATPRGVLQAVYQFQEEVRKWPGWPREFRRSGRFHIPRRIFHQRFDGWPGERADIRYISHLGATHCLVSHDWQSQRNFQQFVTSPIFPHAVDPETVRHNHSALRTVLENCADYGLESCLWMTELPCQGGPWVPEPERQRFLQRYPHEVLSETGTYQGVGLCFSHPLVQEYYRDLVNRFFTAFPEIGTIFLFGRDSGGEFCDPNRCPRCRGIGKLEQRDRLLRFFVEHGARVRPGLRVLTTNWGWERFEDLDELLRRQAALPAESGIFFAAEYDGWQAERQTHDFMRNMREVCRRHRQLFIGYDNFHWGDDTVHHLRDIQDYPLGIGAKIARWHALQVDGVFDHWGARNAQISCNSPALRDFFRNPDADPVETARLLARQQFGDEVAEQVLTGWRLEESAHAILSRAAIWSPEQWPHWYYGMRYAPVPDGFAKHAQHRNLAATALKPKPDGDAGYNAGDFAALLDAVGRAWNTAWPLLRDAAHHLRAAAQFAEEIPVFYSFWWNGTEPVPSRKAHLLGQSLYLESIAVTGREIGLHFALHALYEKTGHDPERYRRESKSLLEQNRDACREASAFFRRLRENGDDLFPSRDWAELFARKADAIEDYLQPNPGG